MNQNEMVSHAEQIAVDFYKRVKYKVGRKSFHRIDLEDLKQEAICFVLGCYADERMNETEYFDRQVTNCLRRFVYRERQIGETEDTSTEQFFDNHGREYDTNLIDDEPFADPSDRAALNEVMSAVDTLPPKQHMAITGLLGGENAYQMSESMGVTPRAVYHRIDSAIHSLRTKLRVA